MKILTSVNITGHLANLPKAGGLGLVEEPGVGPG